jgi:hypothetical protein
MKVSCSDVYNTPSQGRPVVGWHLDSLGMQWQGGIAERDAALWTPTDDIAHPGTVPDAAADLNPFVSELTIIYGADIIRGETVFSQLKRVGWQHGAAGEAD